ncbi:hypothetical protein PCL_12089 [Purpureocillium lilacinum]|uniref:Uncharacterized protein n=1 Tax=Purpureocillium lilacinum TaxID=33203 RepID=A0A2U3DPH2_PURLI|nr:hypothetical protein PCL_12089 [Purpureocillium lilacinum]
MEEESASMTGLPAPERDVTDPIARAALFMQAGHGTTRAPVAPMSADDMDNLPWPDFSQSMDVKGADHRLAECIIVSNYCPTPRDKKKKEKQQNKTAKRQSHDDEAAVTTSIAWNRAGTMQESSIMNTSGIGTSWQVGRFGKAYSWILASGLYISSRTSLYFVRSLNPQLTLRMRLCGIGWLPMILRSHDIVIVCLASRASIPVTGARVNQYFVASEALANEDITRYSSTKS